MTATDPPDNATAHWRGPFGVEDAGVGLDAPPPRVPVVTETAWRALRHGGPDQLAPGLSAVCEALVIRNLSVTLSDPPDRSPLVVYTSSRELTTAYHRLEVRHFGRWASRYPMFFRGEGGELTPLNKRGLPRKTDPPELVFRAFTEEDLSAFADEFPDAFFLLLAEEPAGLPTSRPEPSHAILTGVVPFRDGARGRLTTDCVLQLAQPIEDEDRGAATAPLVREANAASGRVAPVIVESSDPTARSLADLYGEISERESWQRWGAFMNIARRTNLHVQAALFPTHDGAESSSLSSHVYKLDAMMRSGAAPPTAAAREFVGAAHQALQRLETYAPPKVAWLEQYAEELAGEDSTVYVADRPAVEDGERWFRGRDVRDGVEVRRLRRTLAPSRGVTVIPSAPNARLLQQLLSGAAERTVVLLYPWEASVYNGAVGYLEWCARRAGVTGWPRVPRAEDGEEDDVAPRITTKRRTPDFEGFGDASEDPDQSDVPAVDDDRPKVTVETPVAEHEFPEERVVIVLRDGKFREVPARDLNEGDVLAAQRDGSNPSASSVVARICRNHPRMEETRLTAGMWREKLQDHVNKHYAGEDLAHVHREMDPGVSYHQFRSWVKEDHPVTPNRENLLGLMEQLGFGKVLAATVYQAGLDHKAHRRTIRDYLLHLSRNRLDLIYNEIETGDYVDPQHRITVEDLVQIVQFERIERIERKNNAS